MSKKTKDQLAADLLHARSLINKAEELPTDPKLRRAVELAGEAQVLLDRGRYDDAIKVLASAAELDPSLVDRLEAYRRLREEKARVGKVNVPKAINTHLLPKLQTAGFVVEFAGDEVEAWREGSVFRRRGRDGDHFILVGREKAGHMLALNVMRPTAGGQYEDLDLGQVGLSRALLRYLNQSEAQAAVRRLGSALPDILNWLDRRER